MSGKRYGFDKLIVAVIAYFQLAVNDSFAGDATLTWQAPTQNTDGSTIPATGPGSLAGFKIYYKLSTATTETVITVANPAARTYTINSLSTGTWNFQMTAYNVENSESNRTPVLSKTISEPPLPPANTFVTTATVAYNVVKRTNGFVLVSVGSIPLNTPCDRTQSVNGYYAVPISAVTWSGTVRPIVVVAQCSTP